MRVHGVVLLRRHREQPAAPHRCVAPGRRHEHRHLREIVAQDAARLAQEGRTHLAAEAAMLRAGLAACARAVTAAVDDFKAARMRLGAASARRLRVGTTDEAARIEALQRMCGVSDPHGWSRVVPPGLVD